MYAEIAINYKHRQRRSRVTASRQRGEQVFAEVQAERYSSGEGDGHWACLYGGGSINNNKNVSKGSSDDDNSDDVHDNIGSGVNVVGGSSSNDNTNNDDNNIVVVVVEVQVECNDISTSDDNGGDSDDDDNDNDGGGDNVLVVVAMLVELAKNGTKQAGDLGPSAHYVPCHLTHQLIGLKARWGGGGAGGGSNNVGGRCSNNGDDDACGSSSGDSSSGEGIGYNDDDSGDGYHVVSTMGSLRRSSVHRELIMTFSYTRQWIVSYSIRNASQEIAVELQGIPDLIIGNYSDGNLVATLLSYKLGITQCEANKRQIMSLVRSADLAPTSYENDKLFSLKGIDVRPGLSSQVFGPDNNRSLYMTDIYFGESYEKYFHDSQTKEQIEPSNSNIFGSSNHPDVAFSYQLIANSETSMVANNPFHSSFMSTRHHDAY
ncbi:hypothetical protein JHK84_054778 [Glycine max]|nr:hypothetical protein JHK84_054778 [Glycine max]